MKRFALLTFYCILTFMAGCSHIQEGGTGKEQLSNQKIEIVKDMRKAFYNQEWDSFQSFFTDNVYYKVGNIAEVKGPEEVVNYLMNRMPETEYKITSMTDREVWELEDTVIIEYDMEINRERDNKTKKFPCVDTFRFEGNKISEWRAYPMHPLFVTDKD
jgi:limonene-1,2-epoxide hydrolase